MIRVTLMLALLALSPALLAQGDPLTRLIEQAEFWEQRQRADLASEAWRKVLEADPRNQRALEQLLQIETQVGNRVEAERLRARLQAVAPESPVLASPQVTERGVDTLAKARRLARQTLNDEAVVEYRRLFRDGQPPPSLYLEYYETLAGTRDGWAEARRALQARATEAPADNAVALALARILTYREATRRDGIDRLERLAERPETASAAQSAWRQALLWLEAKPADRALYDRFLLLGEDDEVREKRADIERQQQRIQAGRAAEARGRDVEAAYEALEQGDLADAERRFLTQLQTNPRDPDALAGIGLIRLRQSRFAEAQQKLEEAVSARPSLAPRLSEALATARFWSAVNVGRSALASDDPLRADAAFRQALAQARVVTPTADVYADAARARVEAGRAAEAESLLQEGYRRYPDDPIIIAALARRYLQSGREAEADRLTRGGEAAELVNVRVDLLRQRAGVARERGDPVAAERALQEALTLAPESPWVRLDLARLYRAQGREADAESLLAALQDRQGVADAEGILVQALAAAESERWGEALTILEQLPASARNADARQVQRRAWIQYQLQRSRQAIAYGDSRLALETLNAAVAAAGDDPEFTNAIAAGWQQIGDPARAISTLRAAARARTPTLDEQIQYAALLRQLDQGAEFEAVSATLLRSRSLNDRQSRDLEQLVVAHRIGLADQLRERGQIAAAYTQLREVVQRYPDDPQVQSALMRLLSAAGDHEEALVIAESLMRTPPDQPSVQLDAISAALLARDLDRADAWLRMAREEFPDDPAFLRASAQAAEQRGRRAEAARLLRLSEGLEAERLFRERVPQLRFIDPDRPEGYLIPAPIEDLLRSGRADLAGPLLPRAGEEGPAFTLPSGYRLSEALTEPPANLRRPVGAPVQAEQGNRRAVASPRLQLDTRYSGPASLPLGQPTGRAATPKENLARLESSLSPWVNAALSTRARRGEPGLSRLVSLELPLDWASPETRIGRLGVRIKPVVLDAGTLEGENLLRYGALSLINGETDPIDLSADGVAFAVDWTLGGLHVDLGTTPLGFLIESVTGGLHWQVQLNEALTVSVDASRRPVTDSLLAYAGAFDPLLGAAWGGVMRTGARLDLAYDLGRYGVYLNGAYFDLGGRNVEENSLLDLGGGVFYRALRSPRYGDLTVGVNLTTFGYDQNLRHFTFGHGGYFSPQFFLTVAVPLSWEGRYGALRYLAEASIGVQSFREDGAVLYPGRPTLQAELEAIAEFEPTNEAVVTGYASQKNTGLSYAFALGGEVPLTSSVLAGARLALDNARDFEESLFLAYLRYDFGQGVAAERLSYRPTLGGGAQR